MFGIRNKLINVDSKRLSTSMLNVYLKADQTAVPALKNLRRLIPLTMDKKVMPSIQGSTSAG